MDLSRRDGPSGCRHCRYSRLRPVGPPRWDGNVELSEQRRRFFETFGYLTFPGLFHSEAGAITDAFRQVWAANGGMLDGKSDDLERQTVVMPFIDQHAYLSALIDDPRIHGLGAALCGDDFNYMSSDGNVYVGDTPWHSDQVAGNYPCIKIAFYLDRLGADSGCLRVIPGSHHASDRYGRLLAAVDYYRAAPEARTNLPETTWGVRGQDVPATSLGVNPGDVVVFHTELKHASFGGGSRRRMFTILMQARHAECDLDYIRDGLSSLARYGMTRAYGEEMLRTASPARMRHLEQRLANDGHLSEQSVKAGAEGAVHSRRQARQEP